MNNSHPMGSTDRGVIGVVRDRGSVFGWRGGQVWRTCLDARRRFDPPSRAEEANTDGVTRTRQERFADVEDLAEAGDVTAPGGAPWRATGFIVNCPIVATR
jgi:hypothetical protein